MGVSKAGIGSLLVGLVLLLLLWFFAFAPPHSGSISAGLILLVLTAVLGGLALLGVLLVVIGIIILII
jgi:FtsH-binding integral membrane protein